MKKDIHSQKVMRYLVNSSCLEEFDIDIIFYVLTVSKNSSSSGDQPS